MTTATQTSVIVLQLSDALLAQLHPFMAGLGIIVTPHSAQRQLCLSMPAATYAALVERVGDALDYDVRWRPNEDEPDGFVERVRPLELINRTQVGGACGQEGACACEDVAALF